MKFAILDIETTGGSPKNERITEIAIYIHDGDKVIDEFSTLINPEKNIPYFITGLTGITNEMVSDAPRFFEIAKNIVEITKDCVIVGHNVKFDYSFIQNEFSMLGYEFHRKTLCTIKLSRKLLPGFNSYSLGKLCEQLGISINGRHRAEGDAWATTLLFELLQKENLEKKENLILQPNPSTRLKNLNGFLKPEQIDELPPTVGVYYLHDEEGTLLYIGKSKNIHNRILSHLGNKKSLRAQELSDKIAGISYELTGSELIALLKESAEIKNDKPRYNRAQRRSYSALGLYSFKDKKGYINFKISKTNSENRLALTGFNNMTEARNTMNSLIEKYWLCQKLCGMYETEGSCFHFEIRQCNGACISREAVKVYNERAQKLIDALSFENDNMIIIDKGRTDHERSIVSICKGAYKGFGYIDINDSYLNIEDLLSCVTEAHDNKDTRQIIRTWLKKNKPEKILRY